MVSSRKSEYRRKNSEQRIFLQAWLIGKGTTAGHPAMFRPLGVMSKGLPGGGRKQVPAPGHSVKKRFYHLGESVPSPVEAALHGSEIAVGDISDLLVGLALELSQDEHHLVVLG